MAQPPSIGRIVHYRLSEKDTVQITRRRTSTEAIRERMHAGTWPEGVQAHIGNDVQAGEVFPLLIVKVWAGNADAISGRVFLDGSDELAVAGVSPGDEPGTWFWPPFVPPTK